MNGGGGGRWWEEEEGGGGGRRWEGGGRWGKEEEGGVRRKEVRTEIGEEEGVGREEEEGGVEQSTLAYYLSKQQCYPLSGTGHSMFWTVSTTQVLIQFEDIG